ncbi:MAG: Wzz/FepE/Etk N-terminal domain-containing protein [bacterium]
MSQASTHNLWLLLEVLARRRRFIVTLVLLVTVLAVATSLLLPKWYRASALLLPPKDLALPVPGRGQLSEVTSITEGVDLPSMVTTSDVYARILESRTIARRTIEKFDLMTRFGTDKFEKTYKVFLDRSRFLVTDEGLLSISFEDRDPQTAAAVVNSLVEELDRVNREIATERVHQNRVFIEQRLNQIRQELDSARWEFENFQLVNRTVDFDQQTRLAIQQAIVLKIRLAELDIDLKMLERNLSTDNTELVELRHRRQLVSDQLNLLEKSNPDSSFFSLPVAAIPALRGQYEALYSRVKVNESLYNILLEQLEQVKIQENEKTSTISVLDQALPPDTKSRPQRMLIVGGSFGLSVLLAVLVAAFLEYLTRLRQSSPEDYARFSQFAEAFFGWLPGMKKTKRT